MEDSTLLKEIAAEERTPLVEWLLSIIASQSSEIEQLKKQAAQLEAALKKAKKLPAKPQLKASQLEQSPLLAKTKGKRPGSAKRSKKKGFKPDEERMIEPEPVPSGASFNSYREYDVQELIVKAHSIRFQLAE